MTGPADLPRYYELMLPVLRAVADLGGSGSAREISDRVVELARPTDEQLALQYPNREKSVFLDRVDWARSYCKLGGALDSPRRGLFLLTADGRAILSLSASEAEERLRDLDAEVRGRRRIERSFVAEASPDGEPQEEAAPPGDDDSQAPARTWREHLLGRLHALSPDRFEELALLVLRSYGLELRRVGGPGDQGIDGIGTAPLSAVLSATVAVQAKRYDPSRVIARETVALFQRDASAAGAERAVMVTLARYSEPARRAATTATPTVDLIDGDRLCELMLQAEIGVRREPTVDEVWFDRFEA